MACCDRHPLQCIIPPYMVEALKASGEAAALEVADDLEAVSASFRSQREATTAALAFAGIEGLASIAATGGLNRKVYSAEHSSDLQKTLMRSEGEGPHADAAVNEAFDGAGDTYRFLHTIFQRDSLDDRGFPLISSVHVRQKFNNAFWNGSQMAYGDGDGKIFNRLTLSLTVIGHEFSHGLIQFSGGLRYSNQSGALNEHIADVFGCMTDQYKKKHTAEDADWLVGKEILAPTIKGQALRSMKAPGDAYHDPLLGKDPQPRHIEQFVKTTRDNGGVHINSGIPNHAFYLASKEAGGYTWEGVGKVWYNALQRLQNSEATFLQWAEVTLKTASDLFGADSKIQKAVLAGWIGVGLLDSKAQPTPAARDAEAYSASAPAASSAPAEAAIAAEKPSEPGLWDRFVRWLGWR